MVNENIERDVAALMMSPTVSRLVEMAQGMPLDINNADDLRACMATVSRSLIEALDNDRIQFTRDEDRAMFYGLMTVAFDLALDGRLKTAATQVIAH